MSTPPVESRTLRYPLLVVVWLAFVSLLWVGLGILPESRPAGDVGTFALLAGTLFVWAEVHERLARGQSRWHPSAWRERSD